MASSSRASSASSTNGPNHHQRIITRPSGGGAAKPSLSVRTACRADGIVSTPRVADRENWNVSTARSGRHAHAELSPPPRCWLSATVTSAALWWPTILGIVALLAFDYFFHVRRSHVPTLSEAAVWSAIYV